MGACVSSHKKPSAVKNMSLRSGRKNDDDNVVITDSAVKEKVMVVNGNVAVKPQWPLVNNSRDFGNYFYVIVMIFRFSILFLF